MNTRFAVAVHILTFLHAQEGRQATSDFIASSVGTNPSLIRRLLLQLERAGLTTAQRGASGGAALARPGGSITLLDVYRAVDDNTVMIPVHQTASVRCPVGRHIQRTLEARIETVERAVYDELRRSTIADLGRDVTSREQQGEPRVPAG